MLENQLPGALVVKNRPVKVGDMRGGFHPWVRKIPWRRRTRQPTPVSCLGNPTDGGAWWATVHGTAESDTTGSI